MFFKVELIFLLWFFCNDPTNGVVVTYEELRQLNATCHPKDNCAQPRAVDSPGISWSYKCSCSASCSHFGTCCVDSFYNSVQSPRLQPACRKVKLSYTEAAYCMVDRCSGGDSAYETLCNDDWNGESDVMRIVPVTSLFTSLTYKNYFCFRCHEKTDDDFLYWNVWLKSNSTCNVQPEVKDVELTYSGDNSSWVVTLARSDVSIAVDLKFDIPVQIWSLPVECEPDVIMTCSDRWTDGSTRDKCSAYTAIIHIEKGGGSELKYRNAHCALCNFESLDKMSCRSSYGLGISPGVEAVAAPGVIEAAGEDKVPFSFTHLLDINHSDGEKVGRIRKCLGSYSLWDPFARKCRSLTCALPGYVIKDGKCTARKTSY